MPNTTEKDFRFIAFLILGFDTKAIARMMGYNVSTVTQNGIISKIKLQN